jgi:hypothetical protein
MATRRCACHAKRARYDTSPASVGRAGRARQNGSGTWSGLAAPKQPGSYSERKDHCGSRSERGTQAAALLYRHPTVGAFICFAPSPIIRDKFEACSLHLVRYSGTSRVTGRPEIRAVHDNLLRLLEEGMQWSSSGARLDRQGRVGSANRDDLEIPEIALREALANALVHRSYDDPACREQPTRIEVFDDRVEFTSYGALPQSVSVHQLNEAPERSCSVSSAFATGLARIESGDEAGPIVEYRSAVSPSRISGRAIRHCLTAFGCLSWHSGSFAITSRGQDNLEASRREPW